MFARTFIRALSLSTSFAALMLPACSVDEPDPIVGDWEAKASGCPARTQFEIDDDYKGDGRLVLGDCSVCQVNLEVKPQDGGDYEIEVNGVDCQGTLDVDCEIDDDELECEDSEGNRTDFERD